MQPHHFSSQIHDADNSAYIKHQKVIQEQAKKIAELEKKLEDVQNTMATENTDLGMENHNLKQRIKELEEKLNHWIHECEQVDSANDKLKARIKELEASQPKWISVKDRLPNDAEPLETWYIVKFSDGTEYFADWDSDLHIFTNPRCEYTSMVNDVISWCKKSPTTEKSSSVERG